MSTTGRPTGGDWKSELHAFFKARSRDVRGLPASDERLCYVQDVARGLEAGYGPVAPPVRQPFWKRWTSPRPEPTGHIICYDFKRRDFVDLGTHLGVLTDIHDIHAKNPYHGFRFNVVYRKSARP